MPSNIFAPNFVAILALIGLFIWMIGQVILGMFLALITQALNKKPYQSQIILYFAYAALRLVLPMLIILPFTGMTQHNNAVDGFILMFSVICVLAAFIGGIVWTTNKQYQMKSFYD